MDEKLYKNEDFYRHLAHLFYAFAAADRKIVIEEKRSIVASVEKNWTLHTDELDAKEIIYSTLRKIIEG
jgi:predicted NAD/FAD-dependent oxidoreductase